MGINGLWNLGSQPHISSSLTELAQDAFNLNKSGFLGLRLAIDASMLLICSDDAVKRINDPSIDSLKLLHQLSLELLAIPFPVLPLFVFDGPLRPDRKRGRQIVRREFKFELRLKKLCEGFGFEYFLAKGEAEYEIGEMSRLGWVDACWTGDSDIFLQDPDLVIRLPAKFSAFTLKPQHTSPASLSNLTLDVYRSSRLPPFSPVRGISRIDYFCLAVILGGDYDNGLFPRTNDKSQPYKRPNPVFAKQALRLCQSAYPEALDLSFSEALDFARRIDDNQKRDSALTHWGDTAFKTMQYLLPFHPLLPRSFPSFPSELVLNLYITPVTSTAATLAEFSPTWRGASIGSLIETMLDGLSMGSDEMIEVFFGHHGAINGLIMQGIRKQILASPSNPWRALIPPLSQVSVSPTPISIVSTSKHVSSGEIKNYVVNFDITRLVRTIEIGLEKAGMGEVEIEQYQRRVVVPMEIMEAAYGSMAEEWKKKETDSVTIVND